jgi:pyridoxamine 5'-phosphate oxidase-like protein
MGNQHAEIDDSLRPFIEAQRIFFVATAPLDAGGHVNLSPKGLDSFRILGPAKVAYLDYVGSGSETIAHVKENGRIVLTWCAFEGPPNILRLHGRAEVVTPHDAEFQQLRPLFPATPEAGRALIVVTVQRITTSCGFGVPLYRFDRERSQMPDWAERKGADGLREYQQLKNATSIDGLPAVTWIDAGERVSPEFRQRGTHEGSSKKAPKKQKHARIRKPGRHSSKR